MKIKFTIQILLVLFLSCQQTFASNLAEPNIQTLMLNASQGSCNEIDLSFLPGDGSRRIIIACAGNPVSSFPVDNVGYSSGSLFGTGSDLGNGNYVVYNSTGTSTTVTGLDGGTEYYFAAFEFNGFGNNANYLLSNYPQASAISTGFTMTLSSSSGDMCKGDSVRLEVHGAETYSWSPSGSLSSNHDSVVWATPSNSTTYSVTGSDSNGCSDQKGVTITVYNNPNVSIGNYSNRCVNSGTLTMTSGSPNGGSYDGDGVSGNHFNPSSAGVGQHVITYSYTDIHGCSNSDSTVITVLSKPNASFSSLSDVCIDEPEFNLSGGTPSGGNYYGTGVSGNQFDPQNAGIGTHQISYIYTNSNGCADTSTSNQKVRGLPTVLFDSLVDVCLNTPQFTLSGGTPSGGSYSGTGVNNSQFSPLVTGAGTFILNYTYTDSHGCSDDDTTSITVHTLPSVSMTAPSDACQNQGPVALTGGSPSGGTYSGPGIGGSTIFTGIAGPGNHVITYSFTNSNNCTNTASDIMHINPKPLPDLGPDVTACSDVTVHLTAGTFSSYTWSTGAHTASINVDTSGIGLGPFQYILTVTNSFGCANRDTIKVTFDGCSGIEDLMNIKDAVVLFPNPTKTEFNLLTSDRSDVMVYDIKGSLLYEKKNAQGIISFGDDFPAGPYFVKIFQDDFSSYKLIIKN